MTEDNKEAIIIADPLFAGLTRPTMMFGVSVEALIFNFIFTMVLFIGTNSLISLAVFIPIHAVSYLVCLKDPRAFRLLSLALITKGRSVGRRYWGASSSAPLPNKRNLKK